MRPFKESFIMVEIVGIPEVPTVAGGMLGLLRESHTTEPQKPTETQKKNAQGSGLGATPNPEPCLEFLCDAVWVLCHLVV